MKFFWKYLFPPLYGLVFYTILRLVSDLTMGDKFWERRWQQNVIEVGACIVMSFGLVRLPGYFVNKFQKRREQNSVRMVFLEFGEILLITMIIATAVSSLVHVLSNDYPIGIDDLVIVNVLLGLFVLLHYAIVRGNSFIQAFIEQKLLVEKIRNDQLQTELKFLKAQYHPHFLFNALNTIYFQMDENIAEAKKSVEKFSELLRYQLYDQQQTVPISQEIHYLENFIRLQEIRSSEKLQVAVHFDGNLNGQLIYPLLLLPLVENAFKYVGGDYWIRIEAAPDGYGLRFSVHNAVPAEMPSGKAGGIGLENLQRRLQLLYPDRHTFRVEKREDRFVAELVLQELKTEADQH
jgi:two-component system, LytTR family, sensor kinase